MVFKNSISSFYLFTDFVIWKEQVCGMGTQSTHTRRHEAGDSEKRFNTGQRRARVLLLLLPPLCSHTALLQVWLWLCSVLLSPLGVTGILSLGSIEEWFFASKISVAWVRSGTAVQPSTGKHLVVKGWIQHWGLSFSDEILNTFSRVVFLCVTLLTSRTPPLHFLYLDWSWYLRQSSVGGGGWGEAHILPPAYPSVWLNFMANPQEHTPLHFLSWQETVRLWGWEGKEEAHQRVGDSRLRLPGFLHQAPRGLWTPGQVLNKGMI